MANWIVGIIIFILLWTVVTLAVNVILAKHVFERSNKNPSLDEKKNTDSCFKGEETEESSGSRNKHRRALFFMLFVLPLIYRFIEWAGRIFRGTRSKIKVLDFTIVKVSEGEFV